MPSRIRILIVEDHSATADRIGRLLKRESSIDPKIVSTLAEALRASSEWLPDVILLDLILPDARTWQDTVSAIPLLRKPVIVITDVDSEEMRVAAIRAGASDVFQKRTVITVMSVLISAAASAAARRQSMNEHAAAAEANHDATE